MAGDTSLKEVITVQVGNYSNFVGSHFWNLQEALLYDSNSDGESSEINHKILYREGQNLCGERTCKPRVICLDFKENISRLQQCDDEVSDSVEGNAWDGKIEKYDWGTGVATKQVNESHTQNITEKFGDIRRFQDVDVSSWLDYSLVRFHAKSLQVIENYHIAESFDNFGRGQRLFQTPKFRDDFEDRLHFFTEECDHLQGFQIFTDIHNSFGGLMSGILEELDEEYRKKSHLCFANMPAAFPDDTRWAADQRILNIILGFAKFVDSNCLTFPMSLRNSFGLKSTSVALPWIEYKETLDYHTSAVLATAIDTATMSYRLTDPQVIDMKSLTGSISSCGRKIAAISAGTPVPVNSTLTLKDLFKENGCFFDNFTSMTPDVAKPGNILSQTTTIRGVPLRLLKKNDYAKTTQWLASILQSNAKQYSPGLYSCHVAQQPCMLTSQFPDIFKCSVTPVGCVVEDYQRPKEQAVQKTSVMTSLQSCENIGKLLDVLVARAKQANVKKHQEFLDAGVEQGDIENSLETLNVMKQAYHLRYEL